MVELYRQERGLAAEEVRETGLWRHKDVEWLAASPDRLIGDTMLLEVKTTAQVGAPTPAFLIQIMVQLACTQRFSCDLAQFSYKTKQLRIDRVRYDVDLFRLIYQHLSLVAAKAADLRALCADPRLRGASRSSYSLLTATVSACPARVRFSRRLTREA